MTYVGYSVVELLIQISIKQLLSIANYRLDKVFFFFFILDKYIMCIDLLDCRDRQGKYQLLNKHPTSKE
jgi:hypothetical protein